MSDRIQVDGEALSALMDGELSEFELRRLLARIADEPALLATWERYNMVRAVYQPEPLGLQVSAVSEPGALSNRIMAAIESEPAFSGPELTGASEPDRTMSNNMPANSIWTNQIAKFAVAASVALAVFVGMQSVLNTPQAPSVATQNADATAPLSGNNGNVQLAVDADAQQRLNEYIRSVSIPSRAEPADAPYNVLFESPMLHPVSDLELVQEVERTTP